MSQLFKNNAASALASATTAAATTLTVADGAAFPTPTGGDFFLVTLIGYDVNGNENQWEIVKCTSRTGNELLVVRGQEGTTARIWPQATRIEARLTAASVASPVNVAASYQPLDTELTALASLASAANKLPYFTGSGTAALAGLTAAARSLLDDADVATMRTTLGLGGAAVLNVGTTAGTVAAGDHAHAALYQPLDSELTALASLTSAANKLPYFTGSGTAALTDITSMGRSVLSSIDPSSARTVLQAAAATHTHDSSYQPLSPVLTMLASVSYGPDSLPYFNASSVLATTMITATARSLLDDTTVAAMRTTLGLGTAATVNTGTSGATVPLLNASNTFSDFNRFGSDAPAIKCKKFTGTTADTQGGMVGVPHGLTIGPYGSKLLGATCWVHSTWGGFANRFPPNTVPTGVNAGTDSFYRFTFDGSQFFIANDTTHSANILGQTYVVFFWYGA